MFLKTWNKYKGSWFGRFLFRIMIHRMVPYTGSIYPEILDMDRGYAKLRMCDRKSVRNHLQSIHAAALMNFSEACSGIAFINGIPTNSRAILTSFKIDYIKKARGTLIAESRTPIPVTSEKAEYRAPVEVKDAAGDVVVRAEATWQVRPAN